MRTCFLHGDVCFCVTILCILVHIKRIIFPFKARIFLKTSYLNIVHNVFNLSNCLHPSSRCSNPTNTPLKRVQYPPRIVRRCVLLWAVNGDKNRRQYELSRMGTVCRNFPRQRGLPPYPFPSLILFSPETLLPAPSKIDITGGAENKAQRLAREKTEEKCTTDLVPRARRRPRSCLPRRLHSAESNRRRCAAAAAPPTTCRARCNSRALPATSSFLRRRGR